MKVKFEPAEKQTVPEMDIIINGKRWGRIVGASGHPPKYQCQLLFKGLFHPGGFGETMEEAVKDAIHSGHKQLKEIAEDFAAFIDEIEKTDLYNERGEE